MWLSTNNKIHEINLSNLLKIIFLIVGVSFFLACFHSMPSYCSDYYRMSAEDRIKKINDSSIEELFNIQLCAYYAEGGDGRATRAIADGGEKNVPFLLSKLSKDNDGQTKEMAIFLLSFIDSSNNLSNRNEVIEIIEKTISEMKDDGFKDSANKHLQRMKNKNKTQ